MSKRFLSIQVKTHLHGGHTHAGMHMIGGGDIDAIEILAFPVKHFSPIGIHLGILEALFALLSSDQINLRNRTDPDFGVGFDLSEVRPSHPSASKTCVIEGLVGTRLCPGALGQVGESEASTEDLQMFSARIHGR